MPSFQQKCRTNLKHWMFGCDICQDVCPWNRFSKPTSETEFKPIPEILDLINTGMECNEVKKHSEKYLKNRHSKDQNSKAYNAT